MKVAQVWLEVSSKLASEGIEDTLLEAELLLRQTLEMERNEFYSGLGGELTNSELNKLKQLLTQRLNHKPSAYIRGSREFYGLEFYVDERVLIPRPETELLVDKALEIVQQSSPHPIRYAQGRPNPLIAPLCGVPIVSGQGERGHHYSSPLRGEDEGESVPVYRDRSNDEWAPISGKDLERPLLIADVGTGSGCIAVALAVNLHRSRIFATDISGEALKVAEINCKKHGVADRVQLLSGDLLISLPQPVDIIVANLPYIPDGELDNLAPEVSRFEPRLALAGGVKGLDYIRRLLDQVSGKLRPNGAVLLEVGRGQAEAVAGMARKQFPNVLVAADLGGLPRVVGGRM